MSRIFDALRRVEQMKSGVAVEIPLDAAAPDLDLLNSFSPELGSLDKMERVTYGPQPENHVLGSGERDRAGVERFRLLRYRLYRLRQQRTVRSVLVTSAVPKDGKTTVAANLAAILAQVSDRVLLMDADLRKPGLHAILGLRPSEGLGGCLQGRLELLKSCRQVDPMGFCFLSAGRLPANPAELLQGDTMRGLLKTSTETFDWVVVDSPPVLHLADGRFLANLCDGVIVVAREEHTRREELLGALTALKGTFIAGIVLVSSQKASKDAYSYYAATPPAEDVLNRPLDFGKPTTKGPAPNHD